jgi:diguanylate cyclase (GGDEF)-like protein
MHPRRFVSLLRIGFKRRWPRLSEPYVIVPVCGFLCIVIVWISTLSMGSIERANAKRASITSTRELAETYEAQVVRAVREIDHTLKLVEFASAARSPKAALEDLKHRALLPPDMLFVVGIADAEGNIVVSNRPSASSATVPPREFGSPSPNDTLHIGAPNFNDAEGAWVLQFSRRLGASAKAPSMPGGFVFVTVAASYFVSGYESGKLGDSGLLGLVGADRTFLARRSGETLSVGDSAGLDLHRFAAAQPDGEVPLAALPDDPVRRFTTARRLFAYPLFVIVGLSEAEQMAAVDARFANYLRLATATTALLLFAAGMLSRISWLLTRSRLRARAALEQEIVIRRGIEEQLAYQAKHDKLTGLPNRSLLNDRLHEMICQARRTGDCAAIAFIDLDNFKLINDTLGHSVGDELLRTIATRLKACLRESDTVARLGGDEFILLLPRRSQVERAGAPLPAGGLESDVASLTVKILNEISRPVVLANREISPECSIGISLFPQDGHDVDTLLKHADAAMYRAKERGRHRFQFFTRDLKDEMQSRLELEADLRLALERDEFELVYQPQVCLMGGKITGVEALLRWRHPVKGPIGPNQFIQFAEENGLIHPIGEWVLRRACAQNKAWQEAGLPAIPVAVNMSARQCEERDIDGVVRRALESSGLDPRYLELEITESLSMADAAQGVKLLERLRETGVMLSIDDFGTGFSNLSNLKRYPVDRLKLDRSFVSGIATDLGSLAISQAAITLAHSLHLEVVAEGVETSEQLALLRARRCDYVQGYLFSPPVSAELMTSFLARDQAAPLFKLTGGQTPAESSRGLLRSISGAIAY